MATVESLHESLQKTCADLEGKTNDLKELQMAACVLVDTIAPEAEEATSSPSLLERMKPAPRRLQEDYVKATTKVCVGQALALALAKLDAHQRG